MINRSIARVFVCVIVVDFWLGLTACNPEQTGADADLGTRPAAGAVVARVGNDVITVAYLERAILNKPRAEQIEYISPPQVRELLEILIDRKLMAVAARTTGLDASEQITGELAASGEDSFEQERILAQAYIDFAVAGTSVVSDGAIAGYYSSHLEEFTVPERVRITRVVLPTTVAAAHVAELLRQGQTAESITALSDKSIQAGVLWLQRRGAPGPMEEHAFTLQTGEVSEAFSIASGYALIRVEEHQAERVLTLDEVRSGIVERLAQEGQAGVLADTSAQLRRDADISIQEAVLDSYAWMN